MKIEEAKRKLWNVIKHFNQVGACGINDNTIVVSLMDNSMNSFVSEFEGFKIKVEIVKEIKLKNEKE